MKRYIIAVMVLLVTTGLLISAGYTKEKRKEQVVPKERIVLWNGRDFTGWKLFAQEKDWDASKTWSVNDGVIHCKGLPAGYMRTETDYADYCLHVEWRWPGKAGNSGVLNHMSLPDKVWPRSIECQLWSTMAGDVITIDGIKWKQLVAGSRRIDKKDSRVVMKLKESSEKSLGEWNSYDIICKDDWMVVLVNGILQNVATRTSVTSGKICLQSERTAIEFRNIYIDPIE